MAKKEDDSSRVSSSNSSNAENYSQLLQAFQETHEKANWLALLNNRLKGMNNLLENRVKSLEEEQKIQKQILKSFTKTLLASVTLLFVKIVKILKRKFIIL